MRTTGAAFATLMAVALPVALAGESAAARPLERVVTTESTGLVQRLSQAARHFVDATPCVRSPQAVFTLNLEHAPIPPAAPEAHAVSRALPALIDLPPPTR